MVRLRRTIGAAAPPCNIQQRNSFTLSTPLNSIYYIFYCNHYPLSDPRPLRSIQRIYRPMEALAAVSLAGNIVQFIDIGLKVLHGAKEIHHSMTGSTGDFQNLETVAQEMQRLSLRLNTASNSQPSADEVALRNLAAECRKLSDQVLDIVQKCKPKNAKSKRSSAWSAAKSLYKKREMDEVGQRLDACRNQLNLQINHMMEYVHISLLSYFSSTNNP